MASDNRQNRIPEDDARRLISAHDGDIALLYIWQLLHPAFDAEQAAADLCLTSLEIRSAKEKLDRLFSSASPHTPADPVPQNVSVEPPRYSEQDIRRMLQDGREFQTIVGETARIIGHTLSTPDLEILLGIYDHLALPPEVIMELINYCAERNMEKFGPSRRLSVRTIQKEAYRWAEEEIRSFEAAEYYINRQKMLRKDVSELADVLSLHRESLTATQERYILSWIAMGFETEAVAEAYDRTVLNTGKLSWPYLDKILQAWHRNGLHTIREIREKDGRHSERKQKKSSSVNPVNPEDIFIFEKNEKK
ncbi:MAG: DnaD domain protein [Oscillospiraceae bacterium]|nr:DnaD domain protein [Oscillospiraceae bacterium]